MDPKQYPTFTLNSGTTIPAQGFGTWQLKGQTAYQAVCDALKVGYRHIDTADVYGNHREVGEAIRQSGIPRDEIFLTSKLWHSDLRSADAKRAIHRVLQELQTDYLDLYLIHWPNQAVPIGETLQAMADMQQAGWVKDIGVSNFTVHHMQDAVASGIPFMMNQVEYHPSLQQPKLKEFADQHDILLTAYSPIAQGADLRLPEVQELAKQYQVSTAQVVLNWLWQRGLVSIPRSADPKHIADNFAALSWKVRSKDIELLNKLDTGNRLVIPLINEFKY